MSTRSTPQATPLRSALILTVALAIVSSALHAGTAGASPLPHGSPAAVDRYFASLPAGDRARLGAPTSGVFLTAKQPGAGRHWQEGSIISSARGTFLLWAPFRTTWGRVGSSAGPIGFPVTPSRFTPDMNGAYMHFEGGSVYHSNALGRSHAVWGSIREKWASLGWERSPLGFPATDESPTADGRGRYNHFQAGSIFWSPTTGAHAVWGSIREKWASLGWERSPLGYPLTDERGTPDGIGRFNHFEGGSIYWSPTSGAHAVWGAIRQTWAGLGWERSSLGYPVGPEVRVANGWIQQFQGGTVGWINGGPVVSVTGSSLRSKIVAIAQSQVGVRESSPNFIPGDPYGNNRRGPVNGSWCSDFLSWVWRQAGVQMPVYPFTGDVYRWAQSNTHVRPPSATPKVGDAILKGTSPANTGTSTHIAIVVEVRSDGAIRTIGGNESDSVKYSGWWRPSGHYGYASPVRD